MQKTPSDFISLLLCLGYGASNGKSYPAFECFRYSHLQFDMRGNALLIERPDENGFELHISAGEVKSGHADTKRQLRSFLAAKSLVSFLLFISENKHLVRVVANGVGIHLRKAAHTKHFDNVTFSNFFAYNFTNAKVSVKQNASFEILFSISD